MAAMAPALTDAPAEAHRIRFKLAPPSSTLSPSGVEGNSGTSHILVSSNGAVKRKSSEERPARGAGPCKREEPTCVDAPPTHLSKFQPLVTSYRCSDVMSVHSTKESLKLQGVLLQNHGILPSFLPRKHQTLELSEEQFKSIMSGGSGSAPCSPPALQGTPMNGMAKKLTKQSPDNRDNAVTLNGGRHTEQESLSHSHVVASHGGLIGNGPLRGATEQHHCPRDVSQDHHSNQESSSFLHPVAPLDLDEEKVSGRLPSLTADTSVASPAALQYPLGSLGTELRDRTQQSQSRQGEIEGRLRRLRKRLQVVQAKQVERHVQQQLGGLLRSTLGPLDALRQQQGRHSTDAFTPQERDRLSRFLKGGSVPAELERLSLSGTTNLRSAEGAFDSDATESSSGGETDVEEDELARVDIEQRHIPLWRRAEGRHAVDRASIISHWNWLQAHVSDLEYRIRQQTDIYRQIRTNKGPVVLGESSVCESVTEDTVSRMDSFTWPASQVCDADGTEGSILAHGITMETNLRKGCSPVPQVNGVINSLRSSSPESAELEEQLNLQQQRPGSTSDSSCVAARTRPLLSCKRRHLLRPNSITNLNRKLPVQKQAGPGRCACEVSGQCVICSGRSLVPPDVQFQLPLLDRLAQFDPCVHPILSFPDDVGVSLHLQRVLKCHWQGRPLEKIKPIKKLSLKHKLPLSRLPDPLSTSSSKEKHKLSNSLSSAVRLSHHKIRAEKLLRQQSDGGESRQHFRADRSHTSFDKSHSRKRPREHSLERTENMPKVYMEVNSPCSSLLSLNTPSHSPLIRQLSSSESPTPCSLNNATPQPIRRRRGESSFDINNIVIPMSVAATTRVEKLQYKEILTPSWREVDVSSKKISEDDDTAEIEDLSDAMFSQLHLANEEQERSRWSWTASAIAKRRGSRSYKSVDGRTTPLLGGTNPSTPQPSSPDTTHFHLLQDYSSATSPSSPASPEMLMFSGLHTPGSRDSHRLLSNEDTRCSTPDTIYEEMVSQPVQPWERRTFPLDVEPLLEYECQSSPAGERQYRTMRRISGCKTSSSKSESDAGPPSPPPEDSSKQKANTHKHTHQ